MIVRPVVGVKGEAKTRGESKREKPNRKPGEKPQTVSVTGPIIEKEDRHKRSSVRKQASGTSQWFSHKETL